MFPASLRFMLAAIENLLFAHKILLVAHEIRMEVLMGLLELNHEFLKTNVFLLITPFLVVLVICIIDEMFKNVHHDGGGHGVDRHFRIHSEV